MNPEELRELLGKAEFGKLSMTKCPCGHRGCNQYTLSNQCSVGFEKDDADLIIVLWNSIPEILAMADRIAALEAMCEQNQQSALDAASRCIELEAENARYREGLIEAQQWLADVWPIISAVKPEWQEAEMWSDYDEEVFVRRAVVSLKLVALTQGADHDKS